MFKQTEDFTKERLQKLVIFCTRDCVCPEIRSEAVKVAARGIVYSHCIDLKITLSIQSWGDPEVFAVDGHRLKEVTDVEDKVGAQAMIVAVQQNKELGLDLAVLDGKIVKQILAREDLGELEKLELNGVDLVGEANPENTWISLMKASKKWSVEHLIMRASKENWATLASISKTGSINFLTICYRYAGAPWLDEVNLEDARTQLFEKESRNKYDFLAFNIQWTLGIWFKICHKNICKKNHILRKMAGILFVANLYF